MGLGRDQSFLVLIIEALRYQHLWSHMGGTERQKEPGSWCSVHVQLGKVWDEALPMAGREPGHGKPGSSTSCRSGPLLLNTYQYTVHRLSGGARGSQARAKSLNFQKARSL